jgi:acetyl-CoA acyltransferase
MAEAFICDFVRTPIGRYGGALSSVRPDDLAAHVLRAIAARNYSLDPSLIDEVVLGCANQAGEDNRNIARMAVLLAGLPQTLPATTINRLCGSGMDAILVAARAIRSGEADIILAGGAESMSRAPMVMPKASEAFSRRAEIHDTTIGWRFINPAMPVSYTHLTLPTM